MANILKKCLQLDNFGHKVEVVFGGRKLNKENKGHSTVIGFFATVAAYAAMLGYFVVLILR